MLSSLGVALDSENCVDYTTFLRALESDAVGADADAFKRECSVPQRVAKQPATCREGGMLD